MTRGATTTSDGIIKLDSRFEDGAAFMDGSFVPISEARIPILDWGFTRSDVTYDVVHVWGGKFFRLNHHLDRFEKSLSSVRMSIPHNREDVIAILMRLMRLTQLPRRLCRNTLHSWNAPKGHTRPSQMRQPFHRVRCPIRLDRG